MPQAAAGIAFKVAFALGAKGGAFAVAKYAAAAATVVQSVAIGAAINAVLAQNSEVSNEGGTLQTSAAADYPGELIVGTRATGGSLVSWHLSGNRNQTLYYVIALADHRCTALKRVWANGQEQPQTSFPHGQQVELTEFNSGGPRAWLTFYDGRFDQTADPTVSGVSSTWTSAHRGRGVSYVVVRMQYDSDTLVSPPTWLFEVQGGKFYDRRKDSTAGGSGSHRLTDEASWEYTENPAVVWDHYRQGIYRGGKLWWGMARPAGEDAYVEFAARAALCDENVTVTGGGSQKRYAANGIISANETHAAITKDFAAAMGGRVVDRGGHAQILAGEAKSAVMTLDEGDLIMDEAFSYAPKVGFDELVNRVESTYADPDDSYNPAPAPALENATYLAADGGVEHVAQPIFRFETNATRVQRLQKIFLEDSRLQARLTGTFPLKAVKLEPGDWFTFTSDRLGLGSGGKTFMVLQRSLNADLTVTLTAIETDASVTAWTESEAADVSKPDPALVSLADIEAPSITVNAVDLDGTSATLPALQIAWTAPADPRISTILIEYQKSGETAKTSVPADAGLSLALVTDGVVDGVVYSVRARFLAPLNKSDWSSTIQVTTNANFTSGTADSVPWSGVTDDNGQRPDDGADVTADSPAHIALASSVTSLTARTDDAEADIQTVTSALATETAARAAEDTAIRAEFEAGDSANSAAITSVGVAYAAADAALAAQITTVETTANGAQSTASTALTAANNAASAATTAQTAANGAQSTASTALTTATDAASAASLVSLQLGGDSPIPDADYRDANFWNLPASTSFQDMQSLLGLNGETRGIAFSGPRDFTSDWFEVEPGATYEFTYRYWNGFSGFSGYVRPVIHVPGVVWLSARVGQSVNLSGAAGEPGDITAGGIAGTNTFRYKIPSNIRRLQFRTKADFTSATFYQRYEMKRLPQAADVAVLQDAFLDSNGNPVASLDLVTAASGSTPAIIQLRSGDGLQPIRLGGDTEIDGNLVVNGTITSSGLAAAAAGRMQEFTSSSISVLGNDVWTTVMDVTAAATGRPLALQANAGIECTQFDGNGANISVGARFVLHGGPNSSLGAQFLGPTGPLYHFGGPPYTGGVQYGHGYIGPMFPFAIGTPPVTGSVRVRVQFLLKNNNTTLGARRVFIPRLLVTEIT